jgi:hypothetical protein
VAANLAAIIGGILVFHEPTGSGTVGIGARFLAFCLVIAQGGSHARPDARLPPTIERPSRRWLSPGSVAGSG